MAESQPVQVSVSLNDLEVIRAALNSAYHKGVAEDLSEQYRKLSNRQQYSALTRALEGTLGTIEAYIEGANDAE